MGDLAAAPQMPQAEAVVAVNEDTLAPAAVLHAGSLSSHCGDYGTGQGAAERPSRARPGGPGRALGMFISGRSCSKFAAKRSVRLCLAAGEPERPLRPVQEDAWNRISSRDRKRGVGGKRGF